MRVMTWNIHGCVGTDWRRDPARVATAIAAAGADIVALQEIDRRADVAVDAGLVERLAAAAGRHLHLAFTIQRPGRDYGIGLFSRWPLADAQVHDLAVAGREPRVAIEARVDTPAGPVRVVTSHFGLSARERTEQTRRLLAAIGPRSGEPTILLGDFNDWRRPGDLGRRLAPTFPTVLAPRSFPSMAPVFPLDRIFVTAGMTATLIKLAGPFSASDHRPLLAEVQLG